MDLDNLESVVNRVLAAARSRYSLENKSIWAKVASGIAEAIGNIIAKIPR